MSSKHLRKKLLEQEEAAENSDIESEEELPQRSAPVNRFAALGLSEPEESEEEQHEEDGYRVTKEVKASGPNVAEKKKRKKNRNKKKKKANGAEEIEPECDTISSAKSESGQNKQEELYAKYLAVDPREVSAENEMKRLLGKTFGAVPNANSKRRNTSFVPGRIVKAKPTWPPLSSGLSTSVVKVENGITWFKFCHNAVYRELQRLFWAGERMFDHGLIQTIMESNPYHLDSLLIMANTMRVQEDVQTSRDLIERGVYACDLSTCAPFFIFDPSHRLSYYQRENRAFFLLLHRHMRNAGDRRCFNTALQLCKLILMKDPDNDCLAVLMEIDTWALKAKEYTYLIELFANLTHKNLDLLPNFVYSVALAYFNFGDEKKASEMLENALLRFPTVLMQLLDKIGIQPDKSIDNNMDMNGIGHSKTTPGFQMLTEIYVHHSHELWSEPDVLSWLERESTRIVPKFKKELKEEFLKEKEGCLKRYTGIPANVLRHAVIYEITVRGERMITDPMTPPSNQSLEDYPREVPQLFEEELPDDTFITGLLNSLLPEYDGGTPLREQWNNFVARFGLRGEAAVESEGGQAGDDNQQAGEEERRDN